MVSILDVLDNALYNLRDGKLPIQREIGLNQLENAIKQLNNSLDGYVDAEFIEEE